MSSPILFSYLLEDMLQLGGEGTGLYSTPTDRPTDATEERTINGMDEADDLTLDDVVLLVAGGLAPLPDPLPALDPSFLPVVLPYFLSLILSVRPCE